MKTNSGSQNLASRPKSVPYSDKVYSLNDDTTQGTLSVVDLDTKFL